MAIQSCTTIKMLQIVRCTMLDLTSGAHIVQSSDLEHLGTFGSHWNRYGYKGLFDGSNILTQQVDEYEGIGLTVAGNTLRWRSLPRTFELCSV